MEFNFPVQILLSPENQYVRFHWLAECDRKIYKIQTENFCIS